MPAATYNQAYDGVRDVYNAENLYIQANLGLASADDAPVPERATLAASIVDRDAQLGEIVDRLAAGGPLEGLGMVAVMQGCGADLHQALVMRCARIEFVQGFGGAGSWRYLQRLPWPDGGGGVMAPLRTVRDRLGLAKGLDQAGIEQAVAGIASNICFSHFVDEEAWAADGGALVRAWIAYLGSNALRPAPGHRLVAFLCVEQREEPAETGLGALLSRLGLRGRGRASAADALAAFLDDLRRRHAPAARPPTVNIVVPPRLGLIRAKHVGEWIAAAAGFLQDEQIEGQLLTLPRTLFAGNVVERRFEPVFRSLQAELAKAMPPPTRFLEVNR